MTLDLSLKGKHALITGASAGIGRAAALELAALGADITVLARRQDALEALAGELEIAGAGATRAIACNLEDARMLRSSVEQLLTTSGPVHVLINNAGGPPGGPILEASGEDFLTAMRRHLLASHLLVQLVTPGMQSAGFGRIINIISTSVREPIPGLGVSNTTRGAMAAWAKSLSKELPPGITINNVLPGFTDTERLTALARTNAERSGRTPEQVREAWLATVPEGRLGQPGELGAVIAFLASPAASFVRGVSIPVDGGRLNGI